MVVDVPELLVQLLVAVATGALIGLERERRETRKFAGLRTMALLCGAGPITVEIARIEGQPVILGFYFLLALGLAFGTTVVRALYNGEDLGFTTSVTVFVVALLGILIGYGRFFEATSIAIVTVILLAERERLHGYVDSLTDEELRDSLTLGALVFILFPILPNEAVDPYGIVVLRDVLLFAIFVLLIEFSSYVLMRQLGGSKGLAVTGLLAGGANSLAAAGVLARLTTESEEAVTAASFALLLATLSMIVRNVGIAVVLAVELAWLIWQPTLAMGGLTVAAAAVLWRTGETKEDLGIDLDSPFSLRSAAKFALAYVLILLVSVGAGELFGGVGLLATAFAGGLVSSAAVSVTAVTVFTDGTVGGETAVAMVILGIVASLCSKIVLVEFVNSEMRKEAVVPMVLVGVAGLVTVLLSLLVF